MWRVDPSRRRFFVKSLSAMSSRILFSVVRISAVLELLLSDFVLIVCKRVIRPRYIPRLSFRRWNRQVFIIFELWREPKRFPSRLHDFSSFYTMGHRIPRVIIRFRKITQMDNVQFWRAASRKVRNSFFMCSVRRGDFPFWS